MDPLFALLVLVAVIVVVARPARRAPAETQGDHLTRAALLEAQAAKARQRGDHDRADLLAAEAADERWLATWSAA